MYRVSTFAAGLAALAALAFLSSTLVHAQERHRERPAPRPERYATPHWKYDNRYRHDRYYPQRGYVVRTLPPERIVVRYRNEPYFFHAGVWYRHTGPSFIVVNPPIGIVVPLLPLTYSTVVVAGVPYYYANDVYYVQRPEGYVVTAPPEGMVEQSGAASPPPQGVAPGDAPANPSAGTWYYCDSAKAYYPYVAECKEGWRTVPASPPSR